MKNIIQLLILLIFYLTFGKAEPLFKINYENEKNIMCDHAIKKYNKCIYLNNKNININSACAIYNSVPCQSLYSRGIEHIPECSNLDPTVKKEFNLKLKSIFIFMNLICSKDINRNYCPLSEPLYNNGNLILYPSDHRQLQSINKFMKETCQSEKCINAYLNYELRLRNLSKEINFLKNKIVLLQDSVEYLKSDNCTNQFLNLKIDISPNYINKYNSVLIFTLGLLLSVLI